MRTDSVRVSDDALAAVREHITTTFGADYLPEKPNVYKTKADAQDAHEAIRPTSLQYDPETVRPFLTQDQYSLYRLIWNRFVALADDAGHVRRDDRRRHRRPTTSSASRAPCRSSPGWMATYGLTPGEAEPRIGRAQADDDDDGVRRAAAARRRRRLELKALRPEQKFTQPPPRFSEATLVKELEENGIGRPSTYASIIGVLQDRDYVNKTRRPLQADGLGVIISDLLTKSFDDIIDVEYTRSLEEDLDKIEQGKTDYVKTLGEFYKKFKKDLDARRQGDAETSRRASRSARPATSAGRRC